MHLCYVRTYVHTLHKNIDQEKQYIDVIWTFKNILVAQNMGDLLF